MELRSHSNSAVLLCRLIVLVLACMFLILPIESDWAVSSKITRHRSASDLAKGQTENIVIDSRGTVQLGRAAEILVEQFEKVWSVNTIVQSNESVFLGTSPNGGIYKYSLGRLTRIYPQQNETEQDQCRTEPQDSDKQDPEIVNADEHLSNEHIFAMAIDTSGRLLAGISGDKCRLCCFDAGGMETLFEPNDTTYIFAIVIDNSGNIYLGTGPEGKVFQLNRYGKDAKVIFDSLDKNILSLAVDNDGFIYAGSDSRGLVYKINPRTRVVTVLYDSEQPEVTALLFSADLTSGPDVQQPAEKGVLYAAATSANIVRSETRFVTEAVTTSGRPEPTSQQESAGENGQNLKIANTERGTSTEKTARATPVRRPGRPGEASYIYKITRDGFVTDIFTESAVFFCLAEQEGKLLVGSGNDARLFMIDPVTEKQAVIYEDKQASQITSVTVSGNDVYLGTANPAKLLRLNRAFAQNGTYTSDLIDAGQPAKWGKLQIEADIPQGCRVLMASRSGNVKDANDNSFSAWTELVEVTEPIQLRCPPGRFCQYKLVLESEDGRASPLIREIAVASTVPNLAPKVETITAARSDAPNKAGVFKISYKATDENDDKLIYKIDCRKTGRTNWIELKDKVEEDSFEWDGKTVEDGRYEIRVTASDERSNTTTTTLTGSRISDPVVVDNTGPVIRDVERHIERSADAISVTLRLRVFDELSAIGKFDYTIDSNAQWKGSLPDDFVFDTTEESFTLVIDQLKPGEHVLVIRVADDVGNNTYKTFELSL